MSVRLKITLLFSTIVFLLMAFAFAAIYTVAADKREKHIDARLTNLAITTGNFLSRKELFNPKIISKIDSLTAISFTRKTIKAYDASNQKIYSFNDDEADVVNLQTDKIDDVRKQKKVFTMLNKKDIVLYHYTLNGNDLIIVAAGYDVFGHKSLSDLLYILLTTFTSGICIALVAGYFFSARLLQPIAKIADDINEISAQNLAKRIDTGTSPDEWNYLARSLNKLLNRLKESFETQGRFIANASHEISTPLASISSQLDISLQKERSPEEYRRIMTSIRQDMQHLNKLTYTLLEFANASGTPGGIEIKPVRIDEILLRISSEISRSTNGYSTKLDFNKLPESEKKLVIAGNEELLHIAVKNIIFNACKYSKNQQANVSLFAKKTDIMISVMNKGDDIPKNEIENIFIPFYRLERDRNNSGFGLGLSLARRIIRLHGGQITVESGNGETVFTIILTNNSA